MQQVVRASMKFNIQTLLAITWALALVMSLYRHGEPVMLFIFLGMPIVMMVIAITSPRLGTQLDPSRRWYLFLIGKAWLYTIAILLMVAICPVAKPLIPDRLTRAMKGDLYANTRMVTLKLSSEDSTSELGQCRELFDSQGYVGRIRGIRLYEQHASYSTEKPHTLISITVSTNRNDVMSYPAKNLKFKIEPGAILYLMDQ